MMTASQSFAVAVDPTADTILAESIAPGRPARQPSDVAGAKTRISSGPLGTLSLLLRSPNEIVRRCREDDRLRELVIVSLAVTVLGSAVFGAVVGSFRGELQILYSAIKLPLALLATLVLSVPAFHAFAAVLGRPWPLTNLIALVMSAIGRASLVLMAVAPLVWLVVDAGFTYHQCVLVSAAAYGVSGLAAFGLLYRGLDAGRGRLLAVLAFVTVFFAVGGQTAWILRPYLGRPAHIEVPFVRPPEGGFADAVFRSTRSAAGIYERSSAPLPDEWELRECGPGETPYDARCQIRDESPSREEW